jgi:hypothetical protein
MDADGDFNVELTYKADTYKVDEASAAVATKTSAKLQLHNPEDYSFTDGTHSRMIAIPEIDAVIAKLQVAKRSKRMAAQPDSRQVLESSTPSPLAAPLFDKIHVASNDPQYADGLNATVSCELMTNMQRAMPGISIPITLRRIEVC